MEKGKLRIRTKILKKTRFKCKLCFRILDDCLFVDEKTKLLTPYCKVCRLSLQNQGIRHQSHLFIETLSEPKMSAVSATTTTTSDSKKEEQANSHVSSPNANSSVYSIPT